MSQVSEATPRFSHSRLSALADCPRRYRYQYVDALPAAFQTVEAFRGQAVHEALAWLYAEREQSKEPTAQDLVGRFRESWRARHPDRVRVIHAGADAESYGRDAEEWLRRHHATTFATDRRETLALEGRVDMVVGGHAYMGYVDRLARDAATGTLHVIDYKTSRRMPASAEEAGLQLRGYGVAVMDKHGGVEVELEYEYLPLGTSLKETFPRSAAPAVADTIASRIAAALAAEAAGDFPPRPSKLCAWCGYRETCEVSGFTKAGAMSAAPAAPAPARPSATSARAAAEPVGPCPTCGKPLRLRNGRRGPFVGCSAYPSCRYSRDA
jgi:putative RecB family exonuclease